MAARRRTSHASPSRRWTCAGGASRRATAGCLVALSVLVGPGLLTSTQAAATTAGPVISFQRVGTLGPAYVYWGFYTWDDKTSKWTMSPVGANDPKSVPSDGGVAGFRWAMVVKDSRPPRAAGDFSTICRGTAAADGKKRVGIVLDPGTAADAPKGDTPTDPTATCAVVPTTFTTQQALQSVAKIRTDNSGLICGINGYPTKTCSLTVAHPTSPPADRPIPIASIVTGAASTPSTPTGAPTTPPTGSRDSSSSTANDSSSHAGLIVVIVVIVVLAVGGFVVSRRRRT